MPNNGDIKFIGYDTCDKHGDYKVNSIYCSVVDRDIVLDKCPKCLEEFNNKFNDSVNPEKEKKQHKYSCYND